MTSPPSPLTSPARHGPWAALVAFAVRRPMWVLAMLVAVQTVPALSSRDLWVGDEVRHADALRNLVRGGHSLVLEMNGRPYPDKPPLWFLFAGGIERVSGCDERTAFFAATALSAFAFAVATWLLARRTAGAEPPEALAAALVALTVPVTAALSQTTRMDLLFAALVVLAEVALFSGLVRPRANRSVVVGAGAALLATGVKGPLGAALPAAAALGWLAWTGRLRRLLAWDVGAGVAVVAGGVALYLGAVAGEKGWGFVEDMVRDQVLRRVTGARQNAEPVWFYAAWLLPLTLPWCLGLAALPWRRTRSALRAGWGRRRGAGGEAFVAAAALTGFVLLSAMSGKLVVYVAPIVPPLAVRLVRGISRAPERAARRAWTAAAAIGLAGAAAMPFAWVARPWEPQVAGLVPFAAAVGATAVALFWTRGRPVVEVALAGAVGLVAAALVVETAVAPSLDAVMSPRAHAEAIALLAERGYAPVVFRTYEGTYSYYAERALPETGDPAEVARILAANPRVVAAMSRRHFERNLDAFRALRVVSERWLGDGPQVLAVKDDGDTPPLPGLSR